MTLTSGLHSIWVGKHTCTHSQWGRAVEKKRMKKKMRRRGRGHRKEKEEEVEEEEETRKASTLL